MYRLFGKLLGLGNSWQNNSNNNCPWFLLKRVGSTSQLVNLGGNCDCQVDEIRHFLANVMGEIWCKTNAIFDNLPVLKTC